MALRLLSLAHPGVGRAVRRRRSAVRNEGHIDPVSIAWELRDVSETDAFARVAQEAVAAASQYLREAARAEKRIEYKSDIDLVTDTDRHVETLVVEHLRRAFPDHLIVGEESSAGRAPARPRPG